MTGAPENMIAAVRERRRLVVALSAATLIILVVAIAWGRPSYAILTAAPLFAWLVWRSAMGRLAFVVIGGLVTFASAANHLTASKAGYFAGVALVVVAILRRREFWADVRAESALRALLPMTLALVVLVTVTFPVARANHTGLSPWLRDAAAYGLAAVIPLLLWDCDRNADRRLTQLAQALVLACGTLSGLSQVVQWLGERGITSSHILLHILPGLFLPGALAIVLAIQAGHPSNHQHWYALGALTIPLVLLLTGTRSAVAILVCVVLALALGRSDRRRLVLWTGGVITLAAVVLAALVGLAHVMHGGLEQLTRRVTSMPHTLLHLGNDNSYRDRAAEWHVAWLTFKAHPLLGVGPGHYFEWRVAYGITYKLSAYNLDSPVVFLAKFGALGVVALAFIVFGLVRFVRLPRPAALSDATLAFTLYLVLGLFDLPFEWAFEEKDFALGLILLGALAVPRAVAVDGWSFGRHRSHSTGPPAAG